MNLSKYSLLLLFSTTMLISCYHWENNIMYDLEYQGTNFDAEAVEWTCSQPLKTAGLKTTQGGTNRLLGGYNIMGGSRNSGGFWSRTYFSLPSHNTIRFQGKFYMIDNWGTWNDHFKLYFDSSSTDLWYVWFTYAAFANSNKWGNPGYADLSPLTVYFTVPHTANSLTFKAANVFGRTSGVQSLGFRDIVMTFSTEPSAPSLSFCGVTLSFPLVSNVCSCGTGTSMVHAKSGVCGPCDSSCATCNGGGPSKCTSCVSGEYLSSGSCLTCDPSCKTCNGAGPSVCTTCEPPKRLFNGACYECDASCLACSGPGSTACTDCEDGEFLSGGSCYPCDSSCKTCDGTGPSSCTSCSDGEYLESGYCYQCDSSCFACDGPGSSDCLSCGYGEYLTSAGTCFGCDSSCVTCDGAGPNACTSCELDEYFGGSNSCQDCDSSCETCHGGGASNCDSCADGKYLDAGVCLDCDNSCEICYAVGPSSCVSCHDGMYLDGSGSCIPCNSGCLTCDGPGSSDCLSCANGEYLDGSGSCSACDLECLTCNGAGPNACISCQTGKYLAGTSCSACDPPCLTCAGSGSNACSSCIAGTYLAGTSCPNCDPSCATCTGGSSNQCSSCLTNYYSVGTSCFASCESPLVKNSTGGVNYCDTPCTTAGQHAYLEGGCFSSCAYPRIPITMNSFNVCAFPCASISEYFYWNGSCFNNCPSPLSQSTVGTQNSCEFLCGADFTYWDGSCESSCPLPLISETQGTYDPRKFCWSPCQPNEYLYWNGSCLNSCPFPLAGSIWKGQKFCNFPCSSTSNYVYWDGSCESSCQAPLISEIQGSSNPRIFCWYPCQPNEYLYWNGSCLSSCPSPLSGSVSKGQKFCDFPCSSTSEYLHWNGSCKSSCPSPLVSEVQGTNKPRNFCWSPCQANEYVYWNRSCMNDCLSPLVKVIEPYVKFCVNPCGDSANYYLYSNQSCFSTCPNPLSVVKNPGVQYCVNLCPAGTYLYENQTCLSTCLPPYLKRIEPVDVQYCDRPCSHPNIYWYQNASCLPHCKFPYVKFNDSGIIKCLPPCQDDSEYFYMYEKKCLSKCEPPFEIILVDDVIKTCQSGVDISLSDTEKLKDTSTTIANQGEFTSGTMKAATMLQSTSPSSALLAGLSSMLQYIRYMKINYPPKVQILFMVSAANPIKLSFDAQIPLFLYRGVKDYPLPEVFERYNINSNFVHNVWELLLTLFWILMFILALLVLKEMLIKCPRVNLILTKMLEVMKWNFPLMMVCGSSGDIFFYGSLHIRSAPLNDMASIICFTVCVIMMGFVVLILGIAYKIIRNFEQNRRIQREDWKDKWKGYEILYEEYEEKSLWAFSYLTLFVLRGLIFNLTLGNLFDYPLIQCIIINIANLSMFGYLLYTRPLKSLLALLQLFINEGLVNIIEISVMILAIMDKAGINGWRTRVSVGDAIIFVIKAFNTFGLVFMVISMLLLVRTAVKIWRSYRAKGIKSPLKMIRALVFGEEEQEKTKKVFSESVNISVLKRPKILKPSRRVKGEDASNDILYVDSDINTSQMTMNLDQSSIVVSNTLGTKQNEELSGIQIIDMNRSHGPESLEKSEIVLAKEEEVSKEVLSVEMGFNHEISRSAIFEGQRSIEEINGLQFTRRRKIKRELKKSLNKIDLGLEKKDSESGNNISIEK